MRTSTEIKLDLDRATARRLELWRQPAMQRDGASSAELARLTRKLEELWEELRIARAREQSARSGPFARRARKRPERELDRRIVGASEQRRAA